MKDANMEVKRKMGVIYSALENGVSGVRTAKAFANEELEKQKFDAANDMYRGAKKEYYKTMGAFMSGMEFTTGIMPVVVIAVGGVLIMNGRFSYIDLITFTLYVSTFINPVRKLAQFDGTASLNYYASPLNVGDFRSFFTQTSKFFVCFSDFIDKNYVQNNIKLIKGNSNFNKAFYSI